MTTNGIIDNPEEKHKGTVAQFFSDNTLFWEKIYEGDKDNSGYYTYSMTKRKDTVLKFLDSYAGNRSLQVLDAGCGPGIVLEEVFRRGHHGTGVDISHKMINEANHRLGKYVNMVPPCGVGDIEALPFTQKSFDVVLSLGVLMYLPSDDKALSEISRVVKSGGVVLLVLPNLVRINMLMDPYYLYRAIKLAWNRYSKRYLSQDESVLPQDIGTNDNFTNRRYLFTKLPKLLKRYNFTDIRIVGVDYCPMTFWGKELMSAKSNIGISEKLANLSEIRGFGWLHALAYQWIICMTKI